METQARSKQWCSLLHMTGAGKPISSNSSGDKDPVMMTASGWIPADCFCQQNLISIQTYRQHAKKKKNQWFGSKFVISRSITQECYLHIYSIYFFLFVLYALQNAASYMISVTEFNELEL